MGDFFIVIFVIAIVLGFWYLIFLFLKSLILPSKNKQISRQKIKPVIEWAESKGYPLPDEPYGVSFGFAIILGILFGIIPGLILIYTSQKRKDIYDKEIRQLTTKWIDAGKPLPLTVNKKDKLKESSSKEKLILENFEFRTSIDANVDEVYKELVKVLTATEEGKKTFDSIQVDYYEFNNSLLGGLEFVMAYAEVKYEIILSSKKDDTERIWRYSN